MGETVDLLGEPVGVDGLDRLENAGVSARRCASAGSDRRRWRARGARVLGLGKRARLVEELGLSQEPRPRRSSRPSTPHTGNRPRTPRRGRSRPRTGGGRARPRAGDRCDLRHLLHGARNLKARHRHGEVIGSALAHQRPAPPGSTRSPRGRAGCLPSTPQDAREWASDGCSPTSSARNPRRWPDGADRRGAACRWSATSAVRMYSGRYVTSRSKRAVGRRPRGSRSAWLSSRSSGRPPGPAPWGAAALSQEKGLEPRRASVAGLGVSSILHSCSSGGTSAARRGGTMA